MLHNFCIDEGADTEDQFDPDKDRPLPQEYYELQPTASIKGHSKMREKMVEAIENKGYQRPRYNVIRNGNRVVG